MKKFKSLAVLVAVLAVLWPLGSFMAITPDLSSLAWEPYLRSLTLSVLASLGALLLGLPAAWAMAGRGRSCVLIRATALAILLIPPYLAASAWLGIGGELGLVSLSDRVLALMPTSSVEFMDGGNIDLAAMVLALALWPCVAFPAAASLALLGREEREVAILTRGPGASFLRVELPAALPAALIGTVLVFAVSWAELGIPDLFMIKAAPSDILKSFDNCRDYSVAAGRSLPMIVVGLMLALIFALVSSRRAFAELSRSRIRGVSAPRWSMILCGLLCLVSLGGVLGGLVYNAGSWDVLCSAVSLNYGIVLRSLVLAVLSALLATAISAILVWACFKPGRNIWLAIVLGVVSLPLLVPGTLWGLGVLRIREALPAGGLISCMLMWFLDSPLILICAGAARALLGTTLVLAWGRKRISEETFEAGAIAGLGLARTAWLAAGLLRGHLLAALLLGIGLALGEVGAAVLVAPPGCDTLSVWVFNAMHTGHGEVTAALSLVVAGCAAVFGGLAALCAGRR